MSGERETTQALGRCLVHPERPPVGRCRTCSTPVCAECHVRLDGILHCRDCLRTAAKALEPRRRPVAPRLATFAVALCVLIPSLAGVRVLIHGAGLAAGRASRLWSPSDRDEGSGGK